MSSAYLALLFIFTELHQITTLSSLDNMPDRSLEPAYFKPKKKQQELSVEQAQNTKYYEGHQDEPAEKFELQDNLLEESHEYGYGYWMRFSEDQEQSVEAQYFLSRLTTNKKHEDMTYYGDRTLSVFLFRNTFIYSTYDLDENLKSKERPIKLSENINGNWYFICYSKKESKIVGFLVKFGGQSYERFEQYGRHVPSKFYKVLFGGKEFNYLALPGQFANIFFDFDGPAFVESEQNMKNLIARYCNIPQVLMKRTNNQLITEPKRFEPTDKQEMNQFQSDYIVTQYSIKGWFRWINDMRVVEQNSFQLFNLRNSQQKTNRIGDRALEIHQILGGGSKSLINFNTYSIINEQPTITKSLDSNELVWTYIYFAYDIGFLKAFGYLIFPGSAISVIFEGVQHKQITKLFFTIGSDEQQSSFNGQIAYVQVSIGPKSYSEVISIDEEGASNLYLREQRISSKDEIMQSRYDSMQSVYSETYNDAKVNGQSEYSFGIWSRWMRTLPTYLKKRSEIHSIAHLKRQYSKELLEVKFNLEQYMFQSLMEIKYIPQSVEGSWNYIYFGYIREGINGKALGAINFEGKSFETVEFQQKHEFILDVIEFVVGRHNVPAFNGEFARISFSFGPGAFYQESQLKSISPKGLPFLEQVPRQTIQLIGAVSKSPFKEEFEFEQFQGIREYSISGWIKYSGIEKSGEQYHIITLTQRKLSELDNQVSLEITKNDVNYVFNTYTCELTCDKLKTQGSQFGEYWDQWTYIYFGYKHDQTYTFIEYPFTQDQFVIEGIKHFYMAVFSILIGNEKGESNSFSGQLKQWVLNFGDGAYREGGYKTEELNVKVHFGYMAGSDHLEQAKTTKEHSDILNCETKEIKFEQSDTLPLDGVYEYGYGMWIQFKHYANTITLFKPKLLGIARFSLQTVPHLLSIVMTVGNYQFISIDVNIDSEYDAFHESDWVFLYYAYQRQSHSKGLTKGYIVGHKGIRSIEQTILHPLLRDHLNFQIGSAGKNYPQFNGIITGVRVYLGPGAYITEEQLKQMINKLNRKPASNIIDSVIPIVEGRQDEYQNENPIMIEGDSNAYSIQLWIKVKQTKFLYRLTQNEEPTNDKRIGDRALHLMSSDQYLEYSTYSLEAQDIFKPKLTSQCEISTYDQNLWAFVYQAYSKQEQQMITYTKIESKVCEQKLKILHAISSKMWLYLFNDYSFQDKTISGPYSDIKLTIGRGSFITEYAKLPSFIAGNKQQPKIIKEIDLVSKEREFISSEVDSMCEYSVSFWYKFSSTYPNREYKKSEVYQIFRMTSNPEYTEGNIQAGDRMLSAFQVKNAISFNSYDLTDNNPNEYCLIETGRQENRWYFLYAGYKRQLQLAQYHIFDGQEQRSAENKNLLQLPLANYVNVIFDKEKGVSQFNGLIAQLAIQIGAGSFGQSGSFLSGKLMDYMIQYQLPLELTLEYQYQQKNGVVKLDQELKDHDYHDIGSYSLCGWFKLDYQPLAKFEAEQSCLTVVRLYENEKLNDKLLQGDRSLFISICDQSFVRFQTYNLNGIESINEHRLAEESILMDSPQIWHYVYMGYEDLAEEIQVLLRQFDSDVMKKMSGVRHMEPNYLGLLFGQEIDGSVFKGQLQGWSFIFGQHIIFEDLKYQTKLPEYSLIRNNVKQQWHQSNDETTHEFDNPVNEYAIGVWTRWLAEYYDCKSIAFHNIFRLTARKQYEDRAQYGDRVLFTYLTNKNFEFSSYDKKQKLLAVNAQIPYEYVEGEWNYIYFSYKAGKLYGLIIHKQQEKAEHISLEVEHEILAYGQLITKKAEFGFQEFKGELYDLRVFLGENSSLDNSEKVISMINKYHLKIPSIEIAKEYFTWGEEYDTLIDGEKSFQFEFPYPQQTTYSISGWIYLHSKEKNSIDSLQGIWKLTTELGQNTLILLAKSNLLTFGTYTYKKKIAPLWQSREVPMEEWIQVYFGYSDDVGYAYSSSSKGVWEYQFNARHVVPRSFKLLMVDFDSFEKYNGAIRGVQVKWNKPLDPPEDQVLSHQ